MRAESFRFRRSLHGVARRVGFTLAAAAVLMTAAPVEAAAYRVRGGMFNRWRSSPIIVYPSSPSTGRTYYDRGNGSSNLRNMPMMIGG